jgi:hypothetical protein
MIFGRQVNQLAPQGHYCNLVVECNAVVEVKRPLSAHKSVASLLRLRRIRERTRAHYRVGRQVGAFCSPNCEVR